MTGRSEFLSKLIKFGDSKVAADEFSRMLLMAGGPFCIVWGFMVAPHSKISYAMPICWSVSFACFCLQFVLQKSYRLSPIFFASTALSACLGWVAGYCHWEYLMIVGPLPSFVLLVVEKRPRWFGFG